MGGFDPSDPDGFPGGGFSQANIDPNQIFQMFFGGGGGGGHQGFGFGAPDSNDGGDDFFKAFTMGGAGGSRGGRGMNGMNMGGMGGMGGFPGFSFMSGGFGGDPCTQMGG